jgi:hypothetical protein
VCNTVPLTVSRAASCCRRRLKIEELMQKREVLQDNMREIEANWGHRPKDQATLEVIMMLGLEIAQVEQQVKHVHC